MTVWSRKKLSNHRLLHRPPVHKYWTCRTIQRYSSPMNIRFYRLHCSQLVRLYWTMLKMLSQSRGYHFLFQTWYSQTGYVNATAKIEQLAFTAAFISINCVQTSMNGHRFQSILMSTRYHVLFWTRKSKCCTTIVNDNLDLMNVYSRSKASCTLIWTYIVE